ncbi:MAG: hypothetical protein F4W95_12185 [Chloroflexi bacterium]|nr:hypothetical protein [Chloroflexota bacterium]MYD49224.1 hypothetical protein [Chloroflexota bacterium]
MSLMDAEQVICINSDGYQASLVVQKTYRTIPDEEAEQHGLIRVIDETEEDYLYPASYFVAAESARDAERQSHVAD